MGYVTGARQAPTDATTTAVTSLVRAGSYNINGQRSMFNNYMIDGMDNNAYGESNQGFDNQIIQPPPDSIAQFEVVTNNESAEYGRSSGATINVATKSGANQFHATLYEFMRNTDLNAFGYIKPISTKPSPARCIRFSSRSSTATSSAPTSADRSSRTGSSTSSITRVSARRSRPRSLIPFPRQRAQRHSGRRCAGSVESRHVHPGGHALYQLADAGQGRRRSTALKIASFIRAALPGKCTVHRRLPRRAWPPMTAP